MCGIAGYLGHQILSDSTISLCLKSMSHRGPDSAAFRHWSLTNGKQLYFLHSRLQIIDLHSRANQPFHHDKKHLIYNGEIYNYIELKQKLSIQYQFPFKTESDVEVLIAVLETFGLGGLEHCEGMWAFALFDEETQTLSLCRDRFGEKPLYIYLTEHGFYFGSEVKFIQALYQKKLSINMNHLHRYMVNGYKSLNKTQEHFFLGVKLLPSATLFQVGLDGIPKHSQYWKPQFEPNTDMSYAEAVQGVRQRLVHSVQLRLRADQAIAFCMSGGVDSNSLISIAKRIFNYDVHGFTITNPGEERYDEESIVSQIVIELNLKHHFITPSRNDFISQLCDLVRHHDSPISTISYYTHWLLMSQISRLKYRISVSGTSADELFTGYYDHYHAYLHDTQADTLLYHDSLEFWMEHIRPWVRNPYLQDPTLFVKNPFFRDHIYLRQDEFENYMVAPWHEPFSEIFFCHSLLRNRMLNELFHEATPVILHEDDLNAMFFSIENRSPFLDKSLFEFCYQIPTKHLIKNGYTKAILRDAMRGIVPDTVLNNRRKIGFNSNILSFVDLSLQETQEYLLRESPIFDVVKKEKIQLLTNKQFLKNSESKFLFNFMNAKLFLERFL